MRHSIHLFCAVGALALTIALINGCGGDDLTVGGPLPIVSVPSGAPTATPTCVPSGVGCSVTDDNCCAGTTCRSLTLTCG